MELDVILLNVVKYSFDDKDGKNIKGAKLGYITSGVVNTDSQTGNLFSQISIDYDLGSSLVNKLPARAKINVLITPSVNNNVKFILQDIKELKPNVDLFL